MTAHPPTWMRSPASLSATSTPIRDRPVGQLGAVGWREDGAQTRDGTKEPLTCISAGQGPFPVG